MARNLRKITVNDGGQPAPRLASRGPYEEACFGNLVANGTVAFDWEVIDGTENNNITITDSFFAGHTYTGFGYDVATTPPGSPIVALFADFTQTRGGPTILTATNDAHGR